MTAVTSEIVLKCKSLLIQITHSQERETQLRNKLTITKLRGHKSYEVKAGKQNRREENGRI